MNEQNEKAMSQPFISLEMSWLLKLQEFLSVNGPKLHDFIVYSFIYVLMYRVDLIRMNTFEKVIIHWDRNCYFPLIVHYNYIFITITNFYIFIQRLKILQFF